MTDVRAKLSRALSSAPVVWTVRIVLGAVLVFSGWAKAVDPWGTIFKLQDYLGAWGLSAPDELTVIGAFTLSGFEFILGVMLATGCFRRVSAWLTMAFMSVMTLLTLYILIADPVSDCGCFGDALRLSNGATFAKNLVLTPLALIAALYNRNARTLYTARIQWLTLVATWAYIGIIQLVGYMWQPPVDFRPYKVGADIAAIVDSNDADPLMIYEKDGKRQAFGVDSLPDDSWTFVERREQDSDAPARLAILDGDDDITADIFDTQDPLLVLTVSDPERLGMARSSMINRLDRYVTAREGSMVILAGSDDDSAQRWARQQGIIAPVYTADDTDLKTIARGEPAVTYIDRGVIKWKRALFSLSPKFPDDTAGNALDSIDGMAEAKFATKLTILWLVIMVAISFLNVVTLITKKVPATDNADKKDTQQ